jgi:2'-5' RNA ligase
MRLFVGVDVPAPPLDELPVAREESPSHLTLLFLGEIAPADVAGLIDRFRSAVARHSPFRVELRGLGVFPNAARPRILWAGVGEGAEELVRLARTLRDAAGALAPADDRPFSPHLTLLRLRGPQDVERAGRALARAGGQSFGTTRVTEVLLKSSELGREGAVHRVVARLGMDGTLSPPADRA